MKKVNWKKVWGVVKNSALLLPKVISLPIMVPIFYLSMPIVWLLMLFISAIFGLDRYGVVREITLGDMVKSYLWPPIYA